MTDRRDLLDSYLAPPSSPASGDPLDNALQTDRRDVAVRTFFAQRAADAEKAAKANRIARQTGLPGDTVERNYGSIMADIRGRQGADIIRGNDNLTSWFGNPRNAAASADDVPTLGAMSTLVGPNSVGNIALGITPQQYEMGQRAVTDLMRKPSEVPLEERFSRIRAQEQGRQEAIQAERPKATAGSWWRGVGIGVLGGFQQARIGAKAFMADALGLDTQVDAANEEYRQVNDVLAATTPRDMSRIGQAVYGGAISTGLALPALVGTIATGGAGGVAVGLGLAGSQSGLSAYGKYRERGGTANEALLGGVLEGGIEAGTELLPLGALAHGFGKKAIGRFAGEFLLKEMGGEQLATFGQDAVDTAIANPDAKWSQFWADRPGAALDTAVAVIMQTGAVGGGSAVARALRPVERDVEHATDGIASANLMDSVMDTAAASKLRERDPEAFRQFMEQHTEGSPIESVYVPVETMRQLMQSDAFDPDAWDWAPDLAQQVAQATATGGDVVLPMAGVAAHLPGSTAWDTIRQDVRLSPGGMSERESNDFAARYGDLMEEQGRAAADALREENEARAPERKVYDTVLSQAREAGFNLRASQAYADLYASRYASRAARLGTDAWSAFQASNLSIQQELPASVAGYRKADQMDVLVNALRRDAQAPSDRKKLGPSLLDFISARGGLDDVGGDLESLGAGDWHKGKPGKRKLIRRSSADIRASAGQESMLGAAPGSVNGLDTLFRDAVEAGYFPEQMGRDDDAENAIDERNALLDAIAEELGGTPRFAQATGTRAQETQTEVAAAVDDLRRILDEAGLDAATATREEIEAAVNRYGVAPEVDESGRGLNQTVNQPLYVVHNLSADKLRHVGELGGLAAPSLAIASGDIGFDGYGEISLVAPPSVADPKSKGARAFAADIYSPRQPRAKFKVNDKARRAMRSVLAPAASKLGIDIDRQRIGQDDIERGGLAEVEMTDAAKAAWLMEQGEDLPLVYAQAVPPEAPAGLGGFSSTDASELLATPEFIARMQRKYTLASKAAEGKREIQRRIDMSWLDDSGNVSAESEAAQNWAARVAAYNQELASFVPGPTDKIDTYRTGEALTAAIGSRMDSYRKWIRDEFGSVAGAAFFEDDSGRKREYTLANVVRAMTREVRNGEKWNYGAGNVRAAVTPEFRTLADVKAARGSIVSDEKMEALKDEVNGELTALAEKFAPYHRSGSDFGWLDIFADFMKDVAKGPRAVEAWQREWFTKPAPGELLDEAREFLDKLRGLPSDYFEIKMQRAMQLSEFSAAIVPSDASAATRDALRAAGLDLVEYDRKDPGARTAAVQSIGDRVFFQSERGRIDIMADGRNIIRLFEGRDLSTLLHESGHLWLEELRADAERSDAPDGLRADWDAVKAWFAANGAAMEEGGEIPTDAHEMWARGIERYFMEGKAPTSGLSGAFQSFRAWLLRIYQVVQRLGTPLNDDVRDVMARLLATDDAISAAVQDTESQPLSQEALGMTDAEYADHMRIAGKARSDAFDALLFRTMETIRRSRTKEWKAERARVREELSEQVAKRPEFRALAILRARDDTRIALDRTSIVEDYGQDAIALIPKGVPPTVAAVGGVHPDVLAEKVGLRSGRELLDRLMGIQQRENALRATGDKRSAFNETLDAQADELMRQRNGDVLTDGSIEEEALAVIHNDTRATVIASELRALARRIAKDGNGERVATPWTMARDWAQRMVREGLVAEQATAAAISRHQRNEAKAGKEAERAILAGDTNAAFTAKQQQMLNSALFRAAKEAKDEVGAIVKRLGKLASARALPSMDQEYLDRIHDLLEAYDMKPRSAREVAQRESFAAWVKAKEEAGEEVHVPARLRDSGNTNFSKLTVDDLMALDDAVASIAHLGRVKKKLRLAKEERDFEEVVDEFVQGAESLKERAFSADRNRKSSWARRFDAIMVKMEFVADELDGGRSDGIVNKLLVQGATTAANTKSRLTENVLAPLARLYLDMPKAQQRRLSERVTVPEFVEINPETLEVLPGNYSRMDLIAVALNTGNESNYDKMVRGESLAFRQMPDLQWSRGKVEAVLARELKREDWAFVEAVWRQIDTLWPEIERSEREITGVVPERVEARTVTTPFGEIRGGYYPVVYDPARSSRASDSYEDDAARLMGQMGRAVSTPKGHTIERTEYAAPLKLAVEPVLLNHVRRVTTRVAYGAWVRDVLKFVEHPRVRKMIERKVGPEYYAQIRPWIKSQVNDAAMDTNSLHALDQVMRQFRTNATIVGLGLRLTTMLAQLGGLPNSAAEVGGKYLAQGMVEATANMGSIRGFVFERSEEMQRRAQDFDRDVSTAFNDIGKLPTTKLGKALDPAKRVRDAVVPWAFWGIGAVDVNLISIPTWLGAYRRALDEGATEEQAAARGDKAVRKSQGAGRSKDLAAIQNANEGYRVLTMFYSAFNVLYNRQRVAIKDARRGDYRKAAVETGWVMMAAPLLSALLVGDWPQDEEGWPEWAVRKVLFGLWAGVPGARDIAGVIERKVSGQFSMPTTAPLYRAFDGLVKVGEDMVNAAKGDRVSDRWLKHVVETPGYFFGLPTGQLSSTLDYGYAVAKGQQKPEGPVDVAAGIAKGRRDSQE